MKMFIIVVSMLLLVTSALSQEIPIGDDFDDNSLDLNKWDWANREFDGDGKLVETSKVLAYKCEEPTNNDVMDLPWILNDLPFDSDWQVQIDVFNYTTPNTNDAVDSFGIKIRNPDDPSDELFLELYASRLGGPPVRKGFYSALWTDGGETGMADSGEQFVPDGGAVRMEFDSSSKVVTVYYDLNPGNGYTWEPFGSFGLAGSGGTQGNTDWEMVNNFQLLVYGYSANMYVGGNMYGDNLEVIGGTEPRYSRVTLLTPNGGEFVPSGSNFFIEWGAPTEAVSFNLKYSTDNGGTWKTIANDVPGRSSDWTVPTPPNNQTKCLLKVQGKDASGGNVGTDRSDAPFTIGAVKLTAPSDPGISVTSGETYSIEWETYATAAPVETVQLYYTTKANEKPLKWKLITTFSKGDNPGTYPWGVPEVAKTKGKCKVKVVLKNDAKRTIGVDTSDNYFTIQPSP